MDNKLVNVIGEDNFSPAEADIDLDAPELDDISADSPRVSKVTVKVMEMAVGDNDASDDEFDWT